VRLGKRIRELRIQRSLSQREVEEGSRLAAGYVSRVEDGYEVPSLKTLEALADSLGVPLFEFFCDAHGPVATPNLMPRLMLEEQAGAVPPQAPTEIHSRGKGLLTAIRLLLWAASGLVVPRALNRRYRRQHSEADEQDASGVTSQANEPKL